VTDPGPGDAVVLAERLQGICLGAGLTVAAAESCTGGLVVAALTEVPGSSGYVLGGIVTYADEAKRDQLGVPESVLVAHGAVSAQVARALAEAVRERFGTTLGVSVTGVAGPAGGSPEKPVGLTYISVAGPGGTSVARHQWHGDRAANRAESVGAAIVALIEAAESAASTGAGAPPAG
jgi:PncC family amidohydrolase